MSGLAHIVDVARSELLVAGRTVLRQPLSALLVILPLALAVAINAALFSVIDGLLFRPLPFRAPQELIAARLSPRSDSRRDPGKLIKVAQGLAASPLIAGSATISPSETFGEQLDTIADLKIRATAVSPGFFELLGVAPSGRDIGASDRPAAGLVPVVIGAALRDRLSSSQRVDIGGTVSIGGRPTQIVGIAPPGFDYPGGSNIWLPYAADDGIQAPSIVRLARAASIEQLRQQYPDVEFMSLRASIQPAGTRSLIYLFAATAMLLLAASVQVGGLMLSRATARTKEVGVRLALGVSHLRLNAQFALEGAVIALFGFALAWAMTPILVVLLVAQLPEAMTAGQRLDPDLRTFGYAALAAGAGVLLLTLAPLQLHRRTAPLSLLRPGHGLVSATAERWRSALLVAQIACTSLLLFLGGLALNSHLRVTGFDLGFQPRSVWQFSLPGLPSGLPREQRQAASAAREATIAATLRDLEQVAGVEVAAAAVVAPLAGGVYSVVNTAGDQTREGHRARLNLVSSGFFRAIGVKPVEGDFMNRSGEPLDGAVVNRTLARALAINGPVLQQEIQVAGFRGRIVGIVNDFVDSSPGVAPEPQVFVPSARGNVVIVRLAPGSSPAVLESTLRPHWGSFGPVRLRAMTGEVDQMLAPWRSRSVLLSLIAGSCVPLALLGMASALMYSVRVRGREIAIRMALGADPGSVRHGVVRKALVQAGVGLLVGLAGGVFAARVIASQWFGVRPADPTTMLSVALLMLLTAWLSAVIPASRASSVSPASALKDT